MDVHAIKIDLSMYDDVFTATSICRSKENWTHTDKTQTNKFIEQYQNGNSRTNMCVCVCVRMCRLFMRVFGQQAIFFTENGVILILYRIVFPALFFNYIVFVTPCLIPPFFTIIPLSYFLHFSLFFCEILHNCWNHCVAFVTFCKIVNYFNVADQLVKSEQEAKAWLIANLKRWTQGV